MTLFSYEKIFKQNTERNLFQGIAGVVSVFIFLSCATTNENIVRNEIEHHDRETQFSQSYRGSVKNLQKPDGSLTSYIAYAMKNSNELEAQFERWQASAHRISQSRRLPDPVISYAYYISQVETRVGPQRHKVSLKQTFPWPTRLSKGADAAAARSQMQQERFDAMAISISSRVEQIYWRMWEINESRNIHISHEIILAGLSESANGLFMTGRIDLAEQQQIDLARARVQDSLSMLDEQLAQKKSELRGIISAPVDMKVETTSKPQFNRGDIDEAGLLSAVKAHPSLQVYSVAAQSSALEAEKERTQKYPNFTLGIDWIETGNAQNLNTPDSGKDAVIVGIGVSVPLWQRNYQESVDAYHAEEKSFLADGEAATDRAVAQFFQILSQLRDAERRMALYEKTLVPQAESVYESVLGAYATGRSNVASALLAQQDLLELRLQHIAAQADYLINKASLKNLVGHEL